MCTEIGDAHLLSYNECHRALAWRWTACPHRYPGCADTMPLGVKARGRKYEMSNIVRACPNFIPPAHNDSNQQEGLSRFIRLGCKLGCCCTFKDGVLGTRILVPRRHLYRCNAAGS
jgi:hypothetical protein